MINRRLLGTAVLCSLALLGCHKSEPPPPPGAVVINAVPFRDAFASAQGDEQSAARKVMMDIQGSYYPDALSDLDKLSSMPGLTDQQKKAVADLTDEVKRKAQAIAAGQ